MLSNKIKLQKLFVLQHTHTGRTELGPQRQATPKEGEVDPSSQAWAPDSLDLLVCDTSCPRNNGNILTPGSQSRDKPSWAICFDLIRFFLNLREASPH